MTPPFLFYRNSESVIDGAWIGDRQSLHAKLLLDLQGLQHGAFRGHVGIDQVADAAVQRVGQLLHEVGLDRELLRTAKTDCASALLTLLREVSIVAIIVEAPVWVEIERGCAQLSRWSRDRLMSSALHGDLLACRRQTPAP